LTTSSSNKEPQATQTRDAIQNPPKVEEGKFKYPLQGMGRGISEKPQKKRTENKHTHPQIRKENEKKEQKITQDHC
jgi:hypothetical protein